MYKGRSYLVYVTERSLVQTSFFTKEFSARAMGSYRERT